MSELTALFQTIGRGEQAAMNRLLELMYSDLHRLAQRRLRKTTARELLDVGAKQAKLGMLNTLINLYDDLGVSDKIMELAGKHIDLVRKVYGKDDPRLAMALTTFANVAERLDLHAVSEPAYLEAEAILERRHVAKSIGVDANDQLAEIYEGLDTYAGLEDIDAAERALAASWLDLGEPRQAALLPRSAKSIDAGHAVLGERYEKPLRHLQARLGNGGRRLD